MMNDLDIWLNLLRESNLQNVESLIAHLGSIGLTVTIVRWVRKTPLIPEALCTGYKSALWALLFSAVSCVSINLARTGLGDVGVWWQLTPLDTILTWIISMGTWEAKKAIVSSFAPSPGA